MKLELLQILNAFGYPVRLQGSFGPDEAYPESFFTYWNGNSEDGNHYNNKAISTIWYFTVYFYSTDPALVNTILTQTKARLKENGWIVPGKGYDVATDYPSHTGRAIDAFFIEYEEGTQQ